MTRPTAKDWIKKLALDGHIEGGAYKEIYRAATTNPVPYTGNQRNLATSIYFLLKEQEFSAFHRIQSDEQWHFYFGDALVVYEIDADGSMIEHLLHNDPAGPGNLTCVIRAGNWFASCLSAGGEYALVGCTVSPGFDYADFELAVRHKLLADYPQHAILIDRLTHPAPR